jgi:type VII secretion integral membrane protein EccD
VDTPRAGTDYRADAEVFVSKGVWVSESDRSLRRVSVHADAVGVDLALPAAVPVAALIPAIVDILAADDGGRAVASADLVATAYQLSPLGAPALDASTTLAQNGIRDGTILVLTRSATELPAPCFDDAAEAVSATLDMVTRPWTRRSARLTGAVSASWLAGTGVLVLVGSSLVTTDFRPSGATLGIAAMASCVALLAAVSAQRVYRDPAAALTFGLLAVGFSAAAGFVSVPGGPGAPNVLLAAMAAAVTSVVTIRVTGGGAVTLTAVACLAAVIAVTALASVVTAAPLPTISSISAIVSLALLEASARVSIMLTGLSRRLPATLDAEESMPSPDWLADKAIRADNWRTSLIAAFSTWAAVGAIIVGVHGMTTTGFDGVVFATLIGAALLLRARAQLDLRRTLVLIASSVATISTTLIVATAASPRHAVWISAAAAMLAGAVLALGFTTPTITFSPVARRGVALLEYSLLAALVPLACWICGLYSTARRLNLI